jgi:hypothetical protein
MILGGGSELQLDVDDDRTGRIAVALAREALRAPAGQLCRACVEVLAVSGAGITLMAGRQAGPICVSSSRVGLLEDIQFTAGEGPCRDAYDSRMSVHSPNLDAAAFGKWPAFAEVARDAGIRGVFAYPLQSERGNVGVMTLYQDMPGALTAAQHEDSLAIADVLSRTVLSVQDNAGLGELGVGLTDAVDYRAEIYQASGMLSVQLAVPVADALVRLRAYAFAHDRRLADVAADIVARRLRLDDDGPTFRGGGHE